MTYQTTSPQKNHVAHLLELLQKANGAWLDGGHLTREVGTTNLSARLGALKSQGWVIESRKGHEEGFKMYRLAGKGDPQGRRRVVLKLPPAPGGSGWSGEAVDRFQKAAEEAVLREISFLKEPQHDCLLDFLLGDY